MLNMNEDPLADNIYENVPATQHVFGFHIGSKFTNIRPINTSLNDLVLAATDSDCNKSVAIKKILFTNRQSFKYGFRELRLLRRLDHENVVRIFEILGPDGLSVSLNQKFDVKNFSELCIVQELLDANLHSVIQQCKLSHDHVQLFLYQILSGLKYIHSANVIHRDIKPTNILVDVDGLKVKISDFGVARVVDPNYSHKGYLTDRVGTCWYRAPELIITPREYAKSVDIWSVGCVFAEMLTGQPLFPGAHELNQIGRILDLMQLSDNEWNRVSQVLPQNIMRKHRRFPKETIRKRFCGVNTEAVDLLEKLLSFSPSNRVSAAEALQHPYMGKYSCEQDEPSAQRPFCIEHEVDDLSIDSLRHLIHREITEPADICGSYIPLSRSPVSILEEGKDGEGKPDPSVNKGAKIIEIDVKDKFKKNENFGSKSELSIDVKGMENAKEYGQLSPKEKNDMLNNAERRTSLQKAARLRNRLNNDRRVQSPKIQHAEKVDFPSPCVEPSHQIYGYSDRLVSKNMKSGQNDQLKNKKSETTLNPQRNIYMKDASSKSMVDKNQQHRSPNQAANHEFDNLYKLPTEHLNRRSRNNNGRLCKYNKKIKQSLLEDLTRLHLDDLDNERCIGAVGGSCDMSGDHTVNVSRLSPDDVGHTGKPNNESSSSSDEFMG